MLACSAAKTTLDYTRSPGQPEWPLRLIVVGHNPSEKAWELGHYYANPSNRMWKLLATADIVPASFTASNDDDCPITCGVGFTDVVGFPYENFNRMMGHLNRTFWLVHHAHVSRPFFLQVSAQQWLLLAAVIGPRPRRRLPC